MSTSQTYTLDGPRDFTFPFPVRTADQITVSITPGGVLPSSEYQVIGASATASSITIRYPNAPSDGTKSLIIERRTEPQRVSTFLNDLSITATALNAEFDNILQLIRDGILGEFRGDWGSGEAYSELDVVRFAPESNIYLAAESHTSDDFAADLAEGKWTLVADFETGQLNIDAALQAAEDARDKAEQWAQEDEDVEVEPGEFSALHYSEKAADSAAAALESEQNAAPVNAIVAEINTLANIETDVRTVADIDGEVVQVAGVSSDVPTVAGVSSAVDVVASDLAGAGFDYDFGSVTEATDGVVGTPDGYLISVFNIRDEIVAVDGIKTNITSVDSNSTNINTVAGISSDVTTVAGIDSEVTTVSGISTAVTSVNDNETNINTLAGVESELVNLGPISDDIEAVSAIRGNVTTVANDGADIGTVAGISNEVQEVSAYSAQVVNVSDNIVDVNDVSGAITSINTLAPVAADIGTVAGIQTEVTTVSTNAGAVDVVASDLAGAGFDYDFGSITQPTTGETGVPDGYIISVYDIRSDVQAVSDIASDVTTVANNVSDVTNFADVYVGPASSDPTTRTDGSTLQKGDLYFNTTTDDLFVYDGSIWKRYAYSTGDTFTGVVTFEQDVTIEGTVDCGTIA